MKGTYLCKQLSSWMGTELNAIPIERLLLRLDTNDTGYVNLAALQDLVRNGKIKETIKIYSAGKQDSFVLLLSQHFKIFIFRSSPALTHLDRRRHSRKCFKSTYCPQGWYNSDSNRVNVCNEKMAPCLSW